MEKLTNKEEEIMQVLWKLKKAFVKEVIVDLPKPKPHYNTVSTVIRKMEDKGFVKHETFGNTHRYAPNISKKTTEKNIFLLLLIIILKILIKMWFHFLQKKKK